MEWNDIEGVTRIEGRPRLPKDPEVAVDFLHEVFRGSETAKRQTVVDRSAQRTHAERSRLEGLADWLPLSRVVAWDSDGTLRFEPSTDLVDLSLRYAAWVSSQVVHMSQREQSRDHASKIAEIARARMAEDPTGSVPPPSGQGLPSSAQGPDTVSAPSSNDPIREKVLGMLQALDDRFLERRSHTRMALLALLSGQHVLLLGPPGTAKSQLARALCGAFKQARYFEYLLSRFTHPDELFGPVSIPGLKSEDYRRLTDGFLPQAHVAFLDEIFKANSAILNSLLTLINERVFHHGRHRDDVPLLGLLGASNELPDPEGGLGALYDRFLVRLAVPPVADAENFLQIATGDLSSPALPENLALTDTERVTILQRADAVRTSPAVDEALVSLWQEANQREWSISDRRWRQAVHMLKVAAAVDGRAKVSLLDLLLLEAVLAPTPDRTPEVRRCILDRLGDSSIPEHDLRAQWMLLSMDRVAGATGSVPSPAQPWGERMAVRKRHASRFLELHAQATRNLGQDRSAIEDVASDHLWVDRVPSALVAAHIERSRELTAILQVAERYLEMLESPQAAAAGILSELPTVARRVYGHGAVFRLVVEGQEPVGITLSGQREPPHRPRDPGRVEPSTQPVPEISVTAEALLGWLDGEDGPEKLTVDAPSWAGRNVSTALLGLRKIVGGRAVPRPPDLPGP